MDVDISAASTIDDFLGMYEDQTLYFHKETYQVGDLSLSSESCVERCYIKW